MVFFSRIFSTLLVVVGLTMIVRWVFPNTAFHQVYTQVDKICAAIEPGMSVDQVSKIATEGQGNFVKMSLNYGVATKSFCRCGVDLAKGQVISENHKAWCLN